jgi:hypothetical protein
MAEKRFQVLNTDFQLCLVSEKREGKEGNGFFFSGGESWICFGFFIIF